MSYNDDPKMRLTERLADLPDDHGRDTFTDFPTIEAVHHQRHLRVLGDIYGLPSFRKLADLNEKQMLSYQRRSRTELVEGMRAVQEEKISHVGPEGFPE